MAEDSLLYYLILLVTGVIAGVINTLAGGGSNLTLPALMITGMPADVANATNRVGVFLQSLVAIRGFKQHKVLDVRDGWAIILPTLAGSYVGVKLAVLLPEALLKPLLLGTMLAMALLILIKPSTIAPPPGTPVYAVKDRPFAIAALFFAGVYGGFVQAGVGFIIIAALAGSLRYDLLRTNALKMLITAAVTSIALTVFIIEDLVKWGPGLVLAAGTMVGAYLGVKLAVDVSQKSLKWFLFIMTLFACAAALFKT